ncbi:MAG: GNAT family N-acetyltransferase [Granulosicoccaceae bacterium]
MPTLHLDKLLNPQSIAIVGASARDNSPGLIITSNVLEDGYTGDVFLVNPRYKAVLGRVCHKSLKVINSTPDLLIVLSPERTIKRTLKQAHQIGIRVAIVMSAVKDSTALHALAKEIGIRLLGPYCAGIIRPHLKLNATYSANKIEAGHLAIISQSASLGAAILDWAESARVGFSALLSTGGDTDISLPDLLDLLAEDHHTRAIIVYVDRIYQAREFLGAVSAAARIKPVVLMKSTQNSARYCDAITRTGQVFSSDHVLQAALQRAGVVRIRTFSNLFEAAKILTSSARTKGKKLVIISNGAAPSMLACERIETKGFALPSLSESLSGTLANEFKGNWSGKNPVVLRGAEALEVQYTFAIKTIIASGEFDAVLVIYVPDSRNDPLQLAQAVISTQPWPIPVLTTWMGDAQVASSRELFAANNLPTFRTPEAATDGFDFLHRYHVSQQQLLQLPNPASRFTRADVAAAKQLVNASLMQGDRVLGPQKTRSLLKLFDLDVLPGKRVLSVTEAVASAERIGYPVALTLVSPNIKYKAEIGGVRLNINNVSDLREAFEQIETQAKTKRPDAHYRGMLIEAMYCQVNSRNLAVSISRDATFGPMITLSIGGDLTSLLQQRSTQLPPLNQFLIDDMLAEPFIANYLGEFHHSRAIKHKAISHVLRQLSELACELPQVFSVHINPLVVSSTQAVTMNAEVVLQKSRTEHRYDHLAIHPYPWQWIREATLKHNKAIQMRPVRPEDAVQISELIKRMSAESRYFRFMHAINELSPRMVVQFTKLDYDRQMAFVAVSQQVNDVVGVSQYSILSDGISAEFAVAIADDWQGVGLASALMRLLIEHAKDKKIQQLHGDVLATNSAMQHLMNSLGFTAIRKPDELDVLIYTFQLS